jgi:hypothetical protein
LGFRCQCSKAKENGENDFFHIFLFFFISFGLI